MLPKEAKPAARKGKIQLIDATGWSKPLRKNLGKKNCELGAEDIGRMVSLLDPDAFFKSPFQLRYSRDTMEATVLITNPPIFKVTEITETHSEVKGNVAWSIGSMISDWIRVDENGNRQVKKWHNDYVYLFVKRKGEWKLQMLFFHE